MVVDRDSQVKGAMRMCPEVEAPASRKGSFVMVLIRALQVTSLVVLLALAVSTSVVTGPHPHDWCYIMGTAQFCS
jgi:hypothetical protein